MAAVIIPNLTAPAPQHGPPTLRLIEGGRMPSIDAATYRRRRVVAALALVVLVVVGATVARSAVGVAAGWASPRPAPIEGPVVVVEARSGDTLWSLARQVHPTGDVRPVVEAMLGERGHAAVQVGDDVRVPAG